MRSVIIFISALIILSSCGVTTTYSPLYYWGGEQNGTTTYENLTYKDYKTQSPEAICKLVCAYEDIVSHPGGSRQMPPPGICAEYGYLLLQPETAKAFLETATAQQRQIFGSIDYVIFFSERGQEMLKKELEYYPESQRFIEPLIKKFAQ